MVQQVYDYSDAANRDYWKLARKREREMSFAEGDDNKGEPPSQKAPYNGERLEMEVDYIYEFMFRL